jgi:hypothetical protein
MKTEAQKTCGYGEHKRNTKPVDETQTDEGEEYGQEAASLENPIE